MRRDGDMHMSKGCAITVSEGGTKAGGCRIAGMPPSGQVQVDAPFSSPCSFGQQNIGTRLRDAVATAGLYIPLRQTYSCAVLISTPAGCGWRARSCSPASVSPAVAAERREAPASCAVREGDDDGCDVVGVGRVLGLPPVPRLVHQLRTVVG